MTDAWRKRRVLVTGGTGFIGSHLVARLHELGARVGVLARGSPAPPPGLDPHGREWLAADLATPLGVAEPFERFVPTHVFHLAAAGVRPGASAGEILTVNVLGTQRVLEAAHAAGVAAIVCAGSCFEYGAGRCMGEDHPLRPTGVYGASKAAATVLVQTWRRLHRLGATVVRPFTAYGPLEHPSRLVAGAILQALRGEDFPMTRAEQERDFVHVSDLVEGMLLAADAPAEGPELFNLCSGRSVPVREVVASIYRLVGGRGRPLPGRLPEREGDMVQQSGNPERACRVLGWSPRLELEDGLRGTIEWYREHQERALQPAR